MSRGRWKDFLGIPLPVGLALINGTGTTAGLNAGLLLTLLRAESGAPRLNAGFVWRSQAVLPLEGDLLVDGVRVAGASTRFRFPETCTMGIAGWPLRDHQREWKVEVDVDYVRWGSITDFERRPGHAEHGVLKGGDGPPRPGLARRRPPPRSAAG